MKIWQKEYKIVKNIYHDYRERYIIYILERNGKKYFYKELNHDKKDRFYAQILFQKKAEVSDRAIILPKLYDYDFKVEKSWILWEYLLGQHLAEWKPKNIKDFERWLEPIVAMIIELQKIKPAPAEFDIPDRMILRVNQWTKEPIELGKFKTSVKKKIIDFIKKNRSLIKIGFNHSDLVPWHMHEIKYPKFALVDYEGSKNKPLYYDIAYIYHRLYTKLAEPKLADKLLEIYKEKANLPENFDKIFLTILGARITGGFFDCIVNKDGTDIKLHQRLLKNYLEVYNEQN